MIGTTNARECYESGPLLNRIQREVVPRLLLALLEDRKRRGLPEMPPPEDLERIFDAALVLLFRILFLCYAEDRGLLPADRSDDAPEGMRQLRIEIATAAGDDPRLTRNRLASAYAPDGGELLDRLQGLTRTVREGERYPGWLFSASPSAGGHRASRALAILETAKLSDLDLALAIDALSRACVIEGTALAWIDYRSVDVRVLGSVFEGMLAFSLRIADQPTRLRATRKRIEIPIRDPIPAPIGRSGIRIAAGDVYLTNGVGRSERKVSGSYYTPAAIVRDIVERTLQPLLCEHRERWREILSRIEPDAEAANRFLDIKLLDPAMGAGHFLLEALDVLTSGLHEILAEHPGNPVSRALAMECGEPAIAALKHHILQRCLFGVDLNPIAVELAKASLWLEGSVPGQPSSLLDHHLRCGNALVGAFIHELDAERTVTARRETNILASNAAAHSVADSDQAVGSSEGPSAVAALRDALDDHCLRHFREPSPANLRCAFFHWELEFPEVFRHSADTTSRHATPNGFDIIVGNPPFVDMKQIVRTHEHLDGYWRQSKAFVTAQGIYDTYMLFFERAVSLAKPTGRIAFLTPFPWLTQQGGAPLRRLLADSGSLHIVDLSAHAHFGSAVVKVVAAFLHRGNPGDGIAVERNAKVVRFPRSTLDGLFNGQFRIDVGPRALPILEKIRRASRPLQSYYTPTFGLRACSRAKGRFRKQHFLKAHADCANPVRYIEADDLTDWAVVWTGRWLDYQPEWIYSPRTPALFEAPKVLVPSLLGRPILRAVFDREGFYADQSLVCVSETYAVPSLRADDRRPPLASIVKQINSAIPSFYFAHAIVGEALGGGAIHATPGLIARVPIFSQLATSEQPIEDINARVADLCGLTNDERAYVLDWYERTSACSPRARNVLPPRSAPREPLD